MAESEDPREDLGTGDAGAADAHACGNGHDSLHACVPGGFRRVPPAPVVFALGLATGVDLALRFLAIRRAMKLGAKVWAVPLALISSAGILPTVFLKTHPQQK